MQVKTEKVIDTNLYLILAMVMAEIGVMIDHSI